MANEPRAGNRTAGTPGWVRVSLWIGVGLLTILLIMLALGHGPGQHMNMH